MGVIRKEWSSGQFHSSQKIKGDYSQSCNYSTQRKKKNIDYFTLKKKLLMSLTSTQLLEKHYPIYQPFSSSTSTNSHWTIDLGFTAILKKKLKLQRCRGKHMLMTTCSVRLKVIISLLLLSSAKTEPLGLNLPISHRFLSRPTFNFARFHLGCFPFWGSYSDLSGSEFSWCFTLLVHLGFLCNFFGCFVDSCIFGWLAWKQI